METRKGDKVRLKDDSRHGERGIVEDVLASYLVVRVEGSEELVRVAQAHLTNYSLAARKAWEKMPHKRVGRPKGSSKTDRISVTLRIDRQVWERFRCAEQSGLIQDRTATINSVLAIELEKLERKSRVLSPKEKDR